MTVIAPVQSFKRSQSVPEWSLAQLPPNLGRMQGLTRPHPLCRGALAMGFPLHPQVCPENHLA